MSVIDVNGAVGRLPRTGRGLDGAALAAEATRHGIGLVLAYSLRGALYEPVSGNRESREAAEAHPAIVPVATLDPRRHIGLEDEVEQLAKQGFAAVRFFPGRQGWSVGSQAFRRCLEALAPYGLPVFIEADGSMELDEVARVTEEYGLPCVLVGLDYALMAEGLAVAARHSHVLLETHRLATPGAIRLAVNEIGPHRLLFGTGLPERPAGSALNAVWCAEISEDERRLVLGGAARRLMPLPDPLPAAPLGALDYAGRIVDVHAHLGEWPYPLAPVGVADLEAACDRFRIDTVVISSVLAIKYDMQRGNAELAAAIEGRPRLLGYVVLDPNDLDGSTQELDRWLRHPQFVGVKIHCEYARRPTASAEVRRLVAEVARRGVPLLIHNDGPDWPGALAALAAEHPTLPLIVAHGVLPPYSVDRVCQALRDSPNAHLEFASTFPVPGAIERARDFLGVERLPFGSDYNLIDTAYVLGTYASAELTPAERVRVMHDNGWRLFRDRTSRGR